MIKGGGEVQEESVVIFILLLFSLSCAWCTPGSFQCGKGYPSMCVSGRNEASCDAVQGDCLHIPMCSDSATCQAVGTLHQCLCGEGYTGNGIQCANSNGTVTEGAGVVISELELKVTNSFCVF